MSSNQLYPFQRNRYYMGKLLTSADFQAEQDYYNNRDHFMNSLVYGSGVICGLGVVSLDDLSILVESGVALDGAGRQIIQDTSVVRKLSAIEGFDSITSDEVSLCIKYADTLANSVYSVGKSQNEEEFEYSRINEESKLFLLDTAMTENHLDLDTEFFTSGNLYSDEDFLVKLMIPATVSRGRAVRFSVITTKLSGRDIKFTLHGVLQIPGFLAADGSENVRIDIEDIRLEDGQSKTIDYWVNVDKKEIDDTSIILQSGSVHAYKDDEAVEVSTAFDVKVLISDSHPRELVNHEIGRLNLEMKDIGGYDEYIKIADIKLSRTGNSYIIDDIDENVKRYIATPSQELLRGSYLDYFFKYDEIKNTQGVISASEDKKEKIEYSKNVDVPEIATGILEIPLGNNAHRGDVRYSGEILHGLGKGNVYVNIGFEFVSEDPTLGANAKSTIYGNADLFRNDKSEAPMVETAIKVLNDKGSFVVAAKLLEEVDHLVLTYRWYAIRFPVGESGNNAVDYIGKSIIPETPTVVLETRESHYFGIRYENMDSCSVIYELTEDGSGDITPEGIYTAPAKEGVYEIRIYCAEMPVICAYAYAIVKKKGVEEEIKNSKGSVLDDLPIG